MRKFLTMLMCAAVVLTGCGHTETKVGGADAPADITVTDGKTEIKLARIDGNLYYDTGEESKITARCGTLDGNLAKSVSEDEVPKSDGSCNFKCGGYQWSENDTVEVSLDGKWQVFKKLDPSEDVFKYKYCFSVSGRMNNTAAESEFIVLSDDKSVTFDDAAYVLFGSDMRKKKDIYVISL